jgi:hypothetical protein
MWRVYKGTRGPVYVCGVFYVIDIYFFHTFIRYTVEWQATVPRRHAAIYILLLRNKDTRVLAHLHHLRFFGDPASWFASPDHLHTSSPLWTRRETCSATLPYIF